jgi:hypothetical protein
MPGMIVTATQLNQLCGNVSLNILTGYVTATYINNWLLANPVVGGVDPLVTIGMSASDAVTIRAAMADLAFQKVSAFDSSQNVKALYGLGV